MESTVYLFASKRNGFKIGKANCPVRRFKQLGGVNAFLPDASFYVELPEESLAFILETFLHQRYSGWGIAPLATHRYLGDTEYFSMGCYQKVLGFLTQSMERLGCMSADEWVTEATDLDWLRKSGIILGSGRYAAKLIPLIASRSLIY